MNLSHQDESKPHQRMPSDSPPPNSTNPSAVAIDSSGTDQPLSSAASLSPERPLPLAQNHAAQNYAVQNHCLQQLALRLLQVLDLPELFNFAVTELRHLLRVDRAIISQCSVEGHHRIIAESVEPTVSSCLGMSIYEATFVKRSIASFDSSAEWKEGSRSALTPSPAEMASAADLEVTPNADQHSWPDTMLPWINLLHIRARIVVPIFQGRQLWGLLSVHDCTAPRQWHSTEVAWLQQLATHLSLALRQWDLHQQVQHLNDELENQVQARTTELQLAYDFEATLKRITDRVRDSLDEDLILQAAVRELVMVLKISGCNASLYDIEQGTSTTYYEYTTSISPYQGRISKFSAVPEIYTQLLRGQYFQFCSLVPNPERGLVSMLACPILDDQGVIGDLWLIHHKQYSFNEQDIRLVQQVANQCAIALRQARLYKESQSQVKELERLNQLKDDFLSTVSHELRTPLSNIKMAIHMLRNATTQEKRDQYMAILQAECSRETELINDLLDLQRLENDSYSITLEPVNLHEWLPAVVAPFQTRAQNRQQRIEIEIPENIPNVMSDRKSLERILAELLNNACKYTSPNGVIYLSVAHNGRLTRAYSKTTFVVKNQADVPPDELPRMFEKFYRIPKSDPWQQGGTGLGLALVKKLVETLRGSIDVSSEDGWTSLKVTLPMPVAKLKQVIEG